MPSALEPARKGESKPSGLLVDTSYLAVLPKLLVYLDCSYGNAFPSGCLVFPNGANITTCGAAPTAANPAFSVPCWEGEHATFAIVAMVCFACYAIGAQLISPYFAEDYTMRTELQFAEM